MHESVIFTILNEPVGKLIFFFHQSQVKGGAVPDLIISIVKAPREQDIDTALELWILLANAKFSQGCNGGGTDDGILENNSIVDVADIFRGMGRFRTLDTEKMQNPDCKFRELAILNKLAKVGES